MYFVHYKTACNSAGRKNLKIKDMHNIYGITVNGTHTDVSNTERGAKIYATKNGFDKISIRFNCGYNVRIIAIKVNNKWINQ